MKKTCCTCKAEKHLEDFTRNKNSKDGRAIVCKECRKKYYRRIYAIPERRRRILERVERYRSKPGNAEICRERIKRWRHSEKGYPKALATIRRYQRTEKGRLTSKKSCEKYRNNHRERDRVNKSLQKAVAKNKIIKPQTCSRCGKTNCKIDGHHYKGYSWENRYDVMWLCAVCHKKADKENLCQLR